MHQNMCYMKLLMCHQSHDTDCLSLTMSQRWQWTVCDLPPRPSGWPSVQHTLSDRRRRSPHYSLKTHKCSDSGLFHRDNKKKCLDFLWLFLKYIAYIYSFMSWTLNSLCFYILYPLFLLYPLYNFCLEKCYMKNVCLKYQTKNTHYALLLYYCIITDAFVWAQHFNSDGRSIQIHN